MALEGETMPDVQAGIDIQKGVDPFDECMIEPQLSLVIFMFLFILLNGWAIIGLYNNLSIQQNEKDDKGHREAR